MGRAGALRDRDPRRVPIAPGAYEAKFSGKYSHRTIDGGIGHNLPQEAPEPFAEAIFDVGGVT